MLEEIASTLTDFTPSLMMGLGLIIGIEHAFEPDHVAAIGTQMIRKNKKNDSKNIFKSAFTRSSLIGAFWGAGHTTTLVIIGLVVYLFAITIQDEIFSSLEIVVGIMLVSLGISAIWNKKFFKFRHRHPHQHIDGNLHFDAHEHNDVNHKHEHKSYFIGLIHGLAGSGSLVAMTSATFGNIEMALSFIFIFGLGSIIGMILVSGLMGLPFVFANKTQHLNKLFRYITGAISLAIGFSVIFDIGIMHSIFGF